MSMGAAQLIPLRDLPDVNRKDVPHIAAIGESCRRSTIKVLFETSKKEITMSELKGNETQEGSTKPTTGQESEELKEQELEKVSGGRPHFLNTQPLPPYQGF